MSDRPGFRIGPDADPDRYVLGAAVASGAEGILYRGSITTATGLVLAVAVKMLQPRFLSRVDEWHARWSEQVELLRSLQVPGVVRVRDGFVGPLPHAAGEPGEGRTLYLVMNWVEGEPLDEWVRRHPDRNPLEALKMLLEVAVALDLMHSGQSTGGTPVLHRDVKPSNVLVGSEGTVLVDFGLTRGLPEGHRLSGVVGTPGYLAPEAAGAGVYTPASDRYAFGAVAYFVLTGEDPPTGHEPQTLRASLAAVPAFAGLPEAVDRVMELLDADPVVRPRSVANWLGLLRGSSLSGFPEVLAPQAPGRNPQPAFEHEKPSGRRQLRRRLPVVAVICVVLGLFSAVAWRPIFGDDSAARQRSGDERTIDAGLRAGRGEGVGGASTLATTGSWRAVDPGPLATRAEAKAVWTGKEVLVVGGLSIDQYRAFRDGAAFDPAGATWRPIPPRPVAGRVMHAVWTGEELVTFGTDGIALDNLTTGAAYNPVTNVWRNVSLPPSTRVPTDVIWTGRRILAWQPEGPSPGALYDPATDLWTPIRASAVPGAVSYGRALWIGAELAIQGGMAPPNGGPVEQRLFLFDPDQDVWRVSGRLPGDLSPWLFIAGVWTGREAVFTGNGGPGPGATYAYDPKADRWREVANLDSGEAGAPRGGVRLDDGRVVVGGANARDPLQILDPESGEWRGSGPPPGPLTTEAPISVGSSVFLWGIATNEGTAQTRAPNAAWLWSP